MVSIFQPSVLPFRSRQVVKLYQSIWTTEGSSLLVYSCRQQKALATRLPDTPLELVMSYGSPSLDDGINQFITQWITKLVVLPLYLQYFTTTCDSVLNAVSGILKNIDIHPQVTLFIIMLTTLLILMH